MLFFMLWLWFVDVQCWCCVDVTLVISRGYSDVILVSWWWAVDARWLLWWCFTVVILIQNYFHCDVTVKLFSGSPRCYVEVMLILFCCVCVCYRLRGVDVTLMLVWGFDDLALNLWFVVSRLLLGYIDVVLALVWCCFGVIFRVMCYAHIVFLKLLWGHLTCGQFHVVFISLFYVMLMLLYC